MLKWRKSSRSQNGSDNCVEIANLPGVAVVRDSKNPAGPVLVFGSAGFTGFLSRVRGV